MHARGSGCVSGSTAVTSILPEQELQTARSVRPNDVATINKIICAGYLAESLAKLEAASRNAILAETYLLHPHQ